MVLTTLTHINKIHTMHVLDSKESQLFILLPTEARVTFVQSYMLVSKIVVQGMCPTS